MLEYLLVALLDHNLQSLIPFTSAEAMEIEIQKLKLVLHLELVNLPDILRSNSYFTRSIVPEQINDIAGAIVVQDCFEMLTERFLSHFWIPGQVNLLSQASLFPENWYRASYLHMRDEETLRYDHYLLCFAEIGNIALVINTPSIVPSARSMPHAPRDKRNLHIDVVDHSRSLRKVALNQRSEPADVNFLPDEVSVQGKVPEVLLVACNQLQRVRVLLLHPSYAPLS